MPKGTLEIIAGPMFAGKTSALLKKARSFDGEMILIKPSFDTRYGICEIKTHDGVAAEAFNLTNTSEILESKAVEKAQAVFFDEIQFFMEPYFGGDVIACISTLIKRGVHVVCCGLDMNWKGEPFEIISKLKTIADRYTVLHAKLSARRHEFRPEGLYGPRSGNSRIVCRGYERTGLFIQPKRLFKVYSRCRNYIACLAYKNSF